jgi:hypothetical protein
MKRLLLLPLFLLCTIPAKAACSNTSFGNGWTCIQAASTNNAGSGNAVTVTFGSTVTAGHLVTVLIVLCNNVSCSSVFGHAFTLTGTARSSCTQDPGGAPYSSNNIEGTSYSCVGAAGTTIIVTSDGSGGNTPFYLVAMAAEWTGGNTASSFDGSGVVNGGTGTTATATKTINAATDLFACTANNSGSATLTPGSGFTQISQTNAASFHEAKTGVTGSQNGTATWTGSGSWMIFCSSFKSQSGASGRQLGNFITGP